MSEETQSANPWDWLQPHDVQRFGSAILDPEERRRWCKATLIGGLPYLWRYKAAPFRDFVYMKMNMQPGQSVLVIGESIPSCGFEDDIRARIGPEGTIHAVDIIEQARGTTASGFRGRSGLLGTWEWTYSRDFPSDHFDCVAILQSTQHCDDWRETAIDLVRVLKPGGGIVLTEIALSPNIKRAAQLDLHLEYWVDKLYAGVGMKGPEDVSYYAPAELLEAFAGLIDDAGSFTWRGADVVWGTKPERR